MSQAHKKLSRKLESFLNERLCEFPWTIQFTDWNGRIFKAGGDSPHWYENLPLTVVIKTPEAARDLLAMNIMNFMDRYLYQEVDFDKNLFLFSEIQKFAKIKLKIWQILYNRILNFKYQSISKSGKSVKSHYDIPEETLFYLDKVYKSYSCAIFENPNHLCRQEALMSGNGRGDDFDSLEKAQWRKFTNAANFLAPKNGETVLDVGCGYPGLMTVLLEKFSFEKVVGWTHSQNQVDVGRSMLEKFDSKRFDLNLGDYRNDNAIYDHIHSTGMISHVGPEGPNSGLKNYVKEIRKRIKTGGRYVHHSLMIEHSDKSLFDEVGPAFNRKYVWPGFYWYDLGYHINELQENGFQIVKVLNLSSHYAKTSFAWYERLIAQQDKFIKINGEATFRAWRVFLAGSPSGFLSRQGMVYRVFCEAIDTVNTNVKLADPRSQLNSMNVDLIN